MSFLNIIGANVCMISAQIIEETLFFKSDM